MSLFVVLLKTKYSNSNKKIILPNKKIKSQIYEIEAVAENYQCSHIEQSTSHQHCEYQSHISYKLGIFDESFMPKEALHTARLYINTVKYSVLNLFYVYYDGVIDGSQWPPSGNCQAITMTGMRRLDHLHMILEDIILRGVKGDFIELGVWKGGLCILAKAIFHAYKQYDRKIYLADSFEGIPAVNISMYPYDANHVNSDKIEILSSNYTGGYKSVRKFFNLYFNIRSDRARVNREYLRLMLNDELDDGEKEFNVNVEYLIGFFKDSLPLAVKQNKFKCFSVLRLDGDIYESTWQSLEYLYPYLNRGGVVIIDDYSDWIGAFAAVGDFRKKFGIKTPVIQIYHGKNEIVRGAYFRKPDDSEAKYC